MGATITTAAPSKPCGDTGESYFVSDDRQCDRFFKCENGALAGEFLCEDGLVYEPLTTRCVLPFKVSCLGRTLLQTPQPVGRCKRLNGKWAVAGSCDKYLGCLSGRERLVTCQNHLVFDNTTGDCEYHDVANRPVVPPKSGTASHARSALS